MTMAITKDQAPRLPGSARPGVHPTGAGLAPRDLVRIVRKRIWLILLTFLSTCALVGVGTALWQVYAPQYRAEAYLAVSPPQNNFFSADMSTMISKEVIERYKRSQAQLVKHEEVLREAANDKRVQDKVWYRTHRDRVIETFISDLDVAALPETSFIKLSMKGSDKKELPDIVNAVADAFVTFAAKPTRRDREDAVAKLTAEKDRLTKMLTAIREDMRGLRVGGDNEGMRSQQAVVVSKLQEINRDLSKAVSDQAMAEMSAKQFQEQLQNGEQEKNPRVIEAIDLDQTYRQLIFQKGQYETQLDTMKRRYGDRHKTVTHLQTLIDSTEGQIKDRRKEIVQTQVQKESEIRQSQLSMLTKQCQDLTDQLKKTNDESHDLENQIAKYTTKSTEATDIERQISMLDEKLMDRKLVLNRPRPGEDPSVGPVSIGAYATEPRERSQPQWKIMAPVGIVLGLVFGFGLAFLVELTDSSVKNPSDITRKLDMPLLGMVPHIDDLDEELKDIYRAVLEAPLSPAAEAFRHIRTNLFFSGPVQSRRSLLVTSPSAEDGRTTVVTNLGACIAQAGKKVLIVDANFRQAAIAKVFPQAIESQGFSSALIGAVGWRDAVVATEIPNLSVMPAGPMPPNPAELLGSEFARHMVQEMMAEYDQVIFDGSPVMVVTDARVLSAQVDGVIFVIRAGVSNIGEVRRSVDQLARAGTHVVGGVLQGVRVMAGGYLKKNYAAFYEYHQKSLV